MTEVGYCLGSVHYSCANCGGTFPKKWGIYVIKHFATFSVRIWICEDCLRLQLNKIKDKKLGESSHESSLR